MIASLIIAALIVAGGGTAFAAEQSLPGDALYPIKISVNENVRAAVALNAEARADWEVALAERRLSEAEQLASRNQLDAEMSADLEQRFASHVEHAVVRINNLVEAGKTEQAAAVSSRLEANLRAHAVVFAAISGMDNEADVEKYSALIESAALRAKTVASLRAETESSVTAGAEVEAAANGNARAAENKIAEVRRALERMQDRVTAEARAAAQTRLDVAISLHQQGQQQIETGQYGEAFVSFQQSIRSAQEAKTVLSAAYAANVRLNAPIMHVDGAVDGTTEVRAEAQQQATTTMNRVSEKVRVLINEASEIKTKIRQRTEANVQGNASASGSGSGQANTNADTNANASGGANVNTEGEVNGNTNTSGDTAITDDIEAEIETRANTNLNVNFR